jgi:NDP-sugar pyrophosphorylase family protein
VTTTHHPAASMTLLIMAAGAGSRFGGPKQLEPVGPAGERLLDYTVFDAHRAGFNRIVLIIRDELRPGFEELAARWPVDLETEFVVQRLEDVPAGISTNGRTKPWGTTHAVLAAREAVRGPFAVVNADDFYGAEAYRLAAAGAHAARSTGDAMVVAMRLDRTLSTNGAVTRAVCETAGDRVTGIAEVREISQTPDGLRGKHCGAVRPLTGHEQVSMNGWIFAPEMLGLLGEEFATFVRGVQSLDAECMLPETLDALVRRGAVTLRLAEAPGPWFGLTHAADRPLVEAGLRDLSAQGAYPRPLWEAGSGRR